MQQPLPVYEAMVLLAAVPTRQISTARFPGQLTFWPPVSGQPWFGDQGGIGQAAKAAQLAAAIAVIVLDSMHRHRPAGRINGKRVAISYGRAG